MTCREFEDCAGALTLRELSQARNQQLRDHAAECHKCAAWLQQQRTLATAMQTLQARTAAHSAGPGVERTLLLALRQRGSQAVQPEIAHHFTPVAMRPSRFFEGVAYVAIAAAVVVALLLGVRILERRSINPPVNSQGTQPSVSLPSVVADKPEPVPQLPLVARSSVHQTPIRRVQSASTMSPDTTEPSQASWDADYVALMLCDPLSCSGDAQVVRMELPSAGITASGESQMRVADVVVGYDGVVRALRIVD